MIYKLFWFKPEQSLQINTASDCIIAKCDWQEKAFIVKQNILHPYTNKWPGEFSKAWGLQKYKA